MQMSNMKDHDKTYHIESILMDTWLTAFYAVVQSEE